MSENNNYLNKKLNIPVEACAYEEYDPITLTPLNTSTAVRMLELNWNSDDFFEKSVLDIGCNTGALSIFALKIGAKKITAVDVQEPLLEFFRAVNEIHSFNIRIEKKSFNQLTVADDSADVVLMMEVMHWLVEQGDTVENIIKKLVNLTNETLYLETPWDVSEPSIAKNNIVTSENYNPELIIRELTKYFHEVQCSRFMTYFGKMKNSKRILIKATKKRAFIPNLFKLRDLYPIDIELTIGTNRIWLFSSPEGLIILKKIPSYSLLTIIPESILDEFSKLFTANGIIPPPILLDGSYRHISDNGEIYMAFQFRGDVNNLIFNRKETPRPDEKSLLLIAIETRKIFRKTPKYLLQNFSILPLFNFDYDIKYIQNNFTKKLKSKFLKIYPFLKQANQDLSLYSANYNETLIHGDIQVGNLIFDSQKNISLIDLDNVRTGTIYADLLITAILAGTKFKDIWDTIQIQSKEEIRMPKSADIIFSVNYVIGWLNVISSNVNVETEFLIDRALNGLQVAKILYEKVK